MSAQFSRSLLRVALAQVCQNLGWNAVQSSPMEILTDVLEKYIVEMGRYAHRYSEQFGRTEPNLDDLALSFAEMGVNVQELVDYIKHVDSVPFALDVPRYPVEKPHHLNFPKPNSRELAEREEHIDDHYPAIHPGWDEVDTLGNTVQDECGPGRDQDDLSSSTDKRPLNTTGVSDDGSPSKKLRILPDEAAPSNYEMKGVTMSTSGSIVGEGKLPDPKAPPPPTPTTPMTSRPPLFKVQSASSLATEPSTATETSELTPAKTTENSIFSAPLFTENILDTNLKEEVKVEKFPPLRALSGMDTKPPQSPRGRKKSPKGDPYKLKSPVRSPGRPKSKSPARSPGRPRSRSPIRSPPPLSSPTSESAWTPVVERGKSSGTGRSPGRPPKSPGAVGRPPKSPGPGRPPKSPGSASRPPKSPGRPPKSPGRPPKSPGRPKKSPGRPPKSPIKLGRGRPRKDSHIKEYLMTGEPPVGEKPPTKAQLKSPPPLGSFQQPYFPTTIQNLDFSPTSGVYTETVSEVTTTEETNVVQSHSSHVLQRPESKSRGRGRPKKSASAAAVTVETEERTEEDPQDVSGRVTPDWIKQRANVLKQELLQQEQEKGSERKPLPPSLLSLDEPPRLSPIMPLDSGDSVPHKHTSHDKARKKEKKRERESESEREAEKRSKKKMKKLREKLLAMDASPASSPGVTAANTDASKPFEFPSLPDTPKLPLGQPTIQPIRIGFGTGKEKKTFTIKPTEDSDKSDKERKKKKKKKEKERSKDDKRDKNREREKRKKDKREKRDDKKEVLKLKIKVGGRDSVSDTPKSSPKYETDSKTSSRTDRAETPQMHTSQSSSSPTKSMSPLPPKLNSPLYISPVRFTPSPVGSSVPRTPSFGMDSPQQSRSPSPLAHPRRSVGFHRRRSVSPGRTPATSPSPPPPSVKPSSSKADPGPPPPPSTGNKKGVFAETLGTIINENGEIIWICPACKMPDDGSPMIGCDVCDDWYHWPCVDITEEPPEDDPWYCPKHATSKPKKAVPASKRGRGRGRGKKKKT